ncbi:hypothetical protein Poly21_10110 [Allorhodopirellula heiligendammensis]|uniref:Uncharacterized protein n=1 Tax=Allorhodopirellula heiligendammensis TaxID=2714739 RepID=A0A5C6C648_9BACT|nr:hypothetical protein Poly21_10110 [Allorhodopirellula heiligendammensis]
MFWRSRRGFERDLGFHACLGDASVWTRERWAAGKKRRDTAKTGAETRNARGLNWGLRALTGRYFVPSFFKKAQNRLGLFLAAGLPAKAPLPHQSSVSSD